MPTAMVPALFRAVADGNIAAVDGLLAAVADPEARSDLLQAVTFEGDGVLHVAARHGQVNLARVLYVERRTPVMLKAQNNRGDTALHCAATTANALMVNFLLFEIATTDTLGPEPWGFGEFLRTRNENDETCLHEAVRYGRRDIVSSLVVKDDTVVDERRPLADTVDKEGVSPLYLATTLHRAYSADIVRILTDPARIHTASYAGPDGKTALHSAVVVMHSGIIQALLNWNIAARDLVMRADVFGNTPLHYLASSRCPVAIARLVLMRGIELNANVAYKPDAEGSLPIHVAAARGRLDIVQLLLQECPDCLESRGHSGQTLLHVALQNHKIHIVSYICQDNNTGARFRRILNARDGDGNTALHLAVKIGNRLAFCILMRKIEVAPSIANKEGKTPLDLAFLYKEPKATYMLSRHEWMIYSLVIAGASRGAQRWDDLAKGLRVEEKTDKDKMWEKVGKSAAVLAVCATLILSASLALPFNLAKYYEQKQSGTGNLGLAFKAFIASNAVAFVSSFVAVFSCTNAGFASLENQSRLHQLYLGATCLGVASLAIVAAFSLEVYLVFSTGLLIFPAVAGILIIAAMLSGMSLPLESAILHNKTLYFRLGGKTFLRSLFVHNRRMLCRAYQRNPRILFATVLLVAYCGVVATNIFQHKFNIPPNPK